MRRISEVSQVGKELPGSMSRLEQLFYQFLRERTYINNVTVSTREWYECAWKAFTAAPSSRARREAGSHTTRGAARADGDAAPSLAASAADAVDPARWNPMTAVADEARPAPPSSSQREIAFSYAFSMSSVRCLPSARNYGRAASFAIPASAARSTCGTQLPSPR